MAEESVFDKLTSLSEKTGGKTERDPLINFDTSMQKLREVQKKNSEAAVRGAEELNQHSAWDSVQALDLQKKEYESIDFPFDEEDQAGKNIESAKSGDLLTSILPNLYTGLDNKRISEGVTQFEETTRAIISGEEKLTEDKGKELLAIQERIKGISRYSLVAQEGSLPTVSPSAHVTDYFFGDIAMGAMNKGEVKAAQESATQMALYSKGLSQKEVDEAYAGVSGVVQPKYDLIDLAVDLFSGAFIARYTFTGAALLSKAGLQSIKSLISKQGVKAVTKGMVTDALWGGIGAGFMTTADALGGGTISQLISGLLGPSVSKGVFTASRKGLGYFLQSLSKNNHTIYRDLKVGLEKAPTSTAGDKILEIIRQFESGELSVTKTDFISESPAAITARNARENIDEGAIDHLSKVALTALRGDERASTLAQKALGTGELTPYTIIPNTIDPSIRELATNEDLSPMLKNVFEIQETIALKYFNDTSVAADKLFPDTVKISIGLSDNSVQFGNLLGRAVDKFKAGKLGLGKRIFQPDAYFGDLRDLLVRIPSSLEGFKRQMIHQGQDILDSQVFKKLSKEEASDLDDLFRMGTDLNETFSVVEGGLKSLKTKEIFPATDKIISRYYKGRFLMDYFYNVANKVAVATARQQGFKQLDDGFVIRAVKKAKKGTPLEFGVTDIDGIAWSKEMQETGWVAAKIIDTNNPKASAKFKFLSPEEAVQRVKDLNDNISLAPRRKGFSPFRIKKTEKKFFVTKIFKNLETKEYEVSKVAGARDYTEGSKLARDLMDRDPEATYIAHRMQDDTDIVDISMSKKFTSTVRKLSEEELSSLLSAMKQAGISDEEIDALSRYAKSFGLNKKTPFKKRGEERLKAARSISMALEKPGVTIKEAVKGAEEAALEPTQAAMSRYIKEVSSFINFDAWNDKVRTTFMEKYGTALGLESWDELIDPSRYLRTTPRIRSLATEAIEAQGQLKRAFSIPTAKEVELKINWENRADKFYGTKNLQFVGTFIDNHLINMNRYGMSKGLRFLGATTKLGLFNLGQFIVQQTAFLNGAKFFATDPKILADAFSDFNHAYLQAMVGKKLGLPSSPEADNLLALIQRSGYNTGMTVDYADRLMSNLSSFKQTAKNIPGAVIRAGFSPVRGGEGVGKGLVWFAERRNLIKEIKAAKVKGFSSKDIDSDKFLALVTMRAEGTAGNFSKFNQAAMSRGPISSAVTQFIPFALHQLGFMNPFGKDKTIGQKAAVYAAWAGAFGLKGIPGFWDLAAIGEIIASETGHPEAIGATKRYLLETVQNEMGEMGASPEVTTFLQRQITDGTVTAGTGGKINFATRAGTAHLATNFIDGLSYEDIRGPGLNTLIGLVNGTVQSHNHLIALWNSEEFNTVTVAKELSEGALKEVTGPKNILKSFLPAINGRLDPSFMDRMQQFIGVVPGIDVSAREMKTDAFKYKKAMKDFVWSEAKRVASMLDESPKTATAEMIKVMENLGKFSPLDQQRFSRAVIQAWKSKAMPSDIAAQYMLIQQGLDPTIYPE